MAKTKIEKLHDRAGKRHRPYSKDELVLLVHMILEAMVKLEQRIDQLEYNTNPHRMAGHD